MKIKSNAVKDGWLDSIYGIATEKTEEIKCGIPQRSFPFEWSEVPAGTRSFAVVFIDYDNAQYEGVPWIHWIAADIPADRTGFKENEASSGKFFTQGHNSWLIPYAPYDTIEEKYTIGYGGPAPDATPHEYELTLYALDTVLDLPRGFYFNDLRHAMAGHILETATCLMKYRGI